MAAPGPGRLRGFAVVFQAASLAVTVAAGVTVVARKVEAQHERGGAPAQALADRDAPGAAPARADGAADAGANAAARGGAAGAARATPGAEPSAPSGPDAGSPLDYAVIQSEEDIPPELSDEQRRALGTAPVPIHREGRYRSVLAHPRFGGPAVARVGLVLNTVREYNIQTGEFQADFFLSLVSERPMPPVELAFPNGRIDTSYTLVDTPTLRVFRYIGTFTSPVDLRRYPFDTQKLAIEVEDLRAGVDQIIFVADPSRTSLDEGFTITGWGVAGLAARSYRHLYPPRFDRDDLYVSRYNFVLAIDRFSTSAAFSVFVPALIIVLISLTGLWVPFSQLEVRSNTGAPMLAAAVLFHFALIQALPATGYLTRADKIMLALYVSLLLNMLSTWAFFIVRPERRDEVFVTARAVIPPVTVGIMVIGAVV